MTLTAIWDKRRLRRGKCHSASVTGNAFAARLPVLVYGTLRSGQHNAGLVAGRVRFGREIWLPGFTLRANDGSVWPDYTFPFPFALDARPEDAIRCQVLEVLAPHAAEVMADLDRLEVFDPENPEQGLYIRRRVMLPDAEEDAWIYVVGPHHRDAVGRLPRIESGDWTVSSPALTPREPG